MKSKFLLNYVNSSSIKVVLILISFHLAVTIAVSLISHSSLLSHLHNGNGVWNFAQDSYLYHKEAIIQADLLGQGLWLEWWDLHDYHYNVKLISISYWASGFQNPFIFEIINGPIWVVSVIMIYKSSESLFGQDSAIYAPMFMFLPSILMSSTQLLRDPMLIAGMALLCYGWIDFYKNKISFKNFIFISSGFLLIMAMRSYLISVFFLIFLFYLIYMRILKKIKLKDFIVVVSLFLMFSNNEHAYLAQFSANSNESRYQIVENIVHAIPVNNSVSDAPPSVSDAPPSPSVSDSLLISVNNFLDKLSVRVNNMRLGFYKVNAYAGSKIESEKEFNNFSELIGYLPNALANGFLSPFPLQWIQEGRATGEIGRALSGVETVIWYFLIVGFCYLVIVDPDMAKALAPLLLTSIVVIILLGYIVPNSGAIFRMRQGFMIPIEIVAIQGLRLLYYKFFYHN